MCDNLKCDFSLKITTNISVVVVESTLVIRYATSSFNLQLSFLDFQVMCQCHAALVKVFCASFLATVNHTCTIDFHKYRSKSNSQMCQLA